METVAYALSTLGFGFVCFAVGVNMGARYAVKRLTGE
jgi:hypothetical protein